jgi:hypothetical protein
MGVSPQLNTPPPNFFTQQSLASTFGSAPLCSNAGIMVWAKDSPMCSRGNRSLSKIATRSPARWASSAPSVEPAGPPPMTITS